MAAVECNLVNLDDALRTPGQHHNSAISSPSLPSWKSYRRQVFRSVFQADISQPTPNATPNVPTAEHGQAFGIPQTVGGGPKTRAALSQFKDSEDLELPDAHDDHMTRRHGLRSFSGSFEDSLLRTQEASSSSSVADDQSRFDRAWHVVTARIALPSSVAVEDSFGTLPPESQATSQDTSVETEFREAIRLVLYAGTMLPRATHVEDVFAWHTHQIRRHYAQHVLPMLSACASDAPAFVAPEDAQFFDKHMNVVVYSVRTLEAAFRLYFYGLTLLVRGLPKNEQEMAASIAEGERTHTGDPFLPTAETVATRFKQDVNAAVANSMPEGLVVSLRAVFTRFATSILGFDPPAIDEAESNSKSSNSMPFRRRSARGAPIQSMPRRKSRSSTLATATPRPPAEDDRSIQLVRQQMREILVSLYKVGLAGDKFQILFAEIMDEKMVDFIRQSFARSWTVVATGTASAYGRPGSRLSKGAGSSSACIAALNNWIENHYARLSHEVLGCIGAGTSGREPVSLSDVSRWKDVAIGRLSALRMTELFDIVLHWPQSRAGLEDLRISVTTPERRSQLVSTFSAALRTRLLHPACSTLEILQIYVAMIRTFHALDPSNVLLSVAVGPLQFYLCQREDAVRIVVDGLLADPEASSAANTTVADRIAQTRAGSASIARLTSSPTFNAKLSELAGILNDSAQQRRLPVDEEELDWNDMGWVPDPIDAGTNYRRPKSEDVIGTLISAMGSREAFTKEFQSIIAERLLSPQLVFDKEVKVLNLLKKRFGESSLQSCEVMIRDIEDSGRLDATIEHTLHLQNEETDDEGSKQDEHENENEDIDNDFHVVAPKRKTDMEYQAKILSRLYWPTSLGHEHFLLPRPVADMQQMYDQIYEERKAGRKLAWLNHLGQAHVELELDDHRTVAVDCKTHEAAVIYAFQGSDAELQNGPGPVHRSVPELYELLQMDEDLITAALVFWQKQGVLRQDPRDPERYVVIEDLAAAQAEEEEAQPLENPAAAAAAAAATATGTAPSVSTKSQARADDAQRTVYWQFIVGMLTNSAASMPLAQIAMMMKMLMVEGFPWSNEELQDFLGEKVADGVLDVVGGKYRLAKK
ncbi:hypothetical protein SEPCBS57363_004412 [Sporothrix epigloea]|uniref:Anaphase-promoting complex subunit 2 n=1 Tax=Sporothrix epigloea TaxID=1892477 RepID=A0ABP0DS06_9PEZI